MFHSSKFMNHSPQRIHHANNELNNHEYLTNKMTQGGPPPVHDACSMKNALLKSSLNNLNPSNVHGDNFMFSPTDPADFHINKNVLIEPVPMSCSNSYIQTSSNRSRSPSPVISDGDSGYNSSKQMSPVSLVSCKP